MAAPDSEEEEELLQSLGFGERRTSAKKEDKHARKEAQMRARLKSKKRADSEEAKLLWAVAWFSGGVSAATFLELCSRCGCEVGALERLIEQGDVLKVSKNCAEAGLRETISPVSPSRAQMKAYASARKAVAAAAAHFGKVFAIVDDWTLECAAKHRLKGSIGDAKVREAVRVYRDAAGSKKMSKKERAAAQKKPPIVSEAAQLKEWADSVAAQPGAALASSDLMNALEDRPVKSEPEEAPATSAAATPTAKPSAADVGGGLSSLERKVFLRAYESTMAEFGYLDVRMLERRLSWEYPRGRLPWTLEEKVRGLNRICASVNSAVWSFVRSSHICTLTDLEHFIIESNKDFEGLSSFEQLGLGPLHRNPLVMRQFLLPKGASEFPRVLTSDLWAHLAENLPKTPEEAWSPEACIAAYCEEKFGKSSLALSGVRCSAGKFVTWLLSAARRAVSRQEAVLSHKLQGAIRERMRRGADLSGLDLFKTIKNFCAGFKSYADKFLAILRFVSNTFFLGEPESSGARNKRAKALASLLLFAVVGFSPETHEGHALSQIVNSEVEKALAPRLMALPGEKLVAQLIRLEDAYFEVLGVQDHRAAPQSLISFLSEHRPLADVLDEAARSLLGSSQPVYDAALVSEEELISNAKIAVESAERKPGSSFVRFLSDLEEQILRQYDIADFSALRQGRWLVFLSAKAEEIGLREPSGGVECSALDLGEARDLLQATRLMLPKDVVTTQLVTALHSALRLHFGVEACAQAASALEQLVCNMVSEKEDFVDEPGALEGVSFVAASAVAVQSVLGQEEGASMASASEAWAFLRSAPEWEDLASWSHWQWAFEPALGSLDLFLQQRPPLGCEFRAIKLGPGRFIRRPPDSSAKLVALEDAVARAAPVDAARSLLAIALNDGAGVARDLLRDTVVNGLRSMGSGDAAMRFVIEAVTRLPDVLQLSIGDPVFVEAARKSFPALPPFEARNSHEAVCLWKLGLAGFPRTSVPMPATTAIPPTQVCAIKVPEPATPESRKVSAPVDAPSELASPDEIGAAREGVTTAVAESDASDVFARAMRRCGMSINTTSLSEEDAASLRQLREMATRSIDQLSQGLYSESVHFVLELVQNADDNEYDAGVLPTLKITIDDGRLAFENNEIGFREENVLALCSVGDSTKKDRVGYIGHKGIGFKSVFKVSNTPEVHSRNFHFKFDLSTGTLGYVCPIQIPRPDDWSSKSSWTRVVLPLKPGMHELVVSQLSLHPSLLLFLRNLRVLHVEDKSAGSRRVMKLEPAGEDLVYTEEAVLGNPVSRTCWILSRSSFEPPASLATHRRAGVTRTEISMAFPLGTDVRQLTQQSVFAFLPVRAYGFRFVCQADWDLTSSREAVDASSGWSQWLRAQLPDAFARGVQAFCKHYVLLEKKAPSDASKSPAGALAEEDTDSVFESSGIPDGMSHHVLASLLFAFVPLRGQVQEFFAPVVEPIHRLLRETEFVPRLVGGLSKPRNAVLPSPLLPIQPTERYLNALGLSFVPPQNEVSEEVAVSVGMKTLDAGFLVTLLSETARSWSSASDVDIGWLVSVLDLLASDRGIASRMNDLKKLRIIPLLDGTIGSFAVAGRIYDAADIDRRKVLPTRWLAHLTAISAEFRSELILHQRALGLLKHLGLDRAHGHDFVVERVVPSLSSPTHLEEDPTDSARLLAYVCSHASTCDRCRGGKLEELMRGKFPLRALVVESAESDRLLELQANTVVFLSKPFLAGDGSAVPLECLFPPTAAVHFLSAQYLKLSVESVAAWRQFLTRLGVLDCLPIRRSPSSSDYDPWALKIVLDQKPTKERSALLLRAISKSWDNVFSLALSMDTPVREALRIFPWMPSNRGRFFRPQELFLPDRSIVEVLSDFVPYADGAANPKILRSLGVVSELSFDVVSSCLASFSSAGNKDQFSEKKMTPIYQWLARCARDSSRTASEQMIKSLSSIPFVFADGAWVLPASCCWDDPAGVWSPRKTVPPAAQLLASSAKCVIRPLRARYGRDLSETFRSLGIPETPSLESYIELIKYCGTVQTKESILIAMRVLCNLSFFAKEETSRWHRLEDDDDDDDEGSVPVPDISQFHLRVSKLLGDSPAIPTTTKGWASLGDPNLLVGETKLFPGLVFAALDIFELYADSWIKGCAEAMKRTLRLLHVPFAEEHISTEISAESCDSSAREDDLALLSVLALASQMWSLGRLTEQQRSRLSEIWKAVKPVRAQKLIRRCVLRLPSGVTSASTEETQVMCCLDPPLSHWKPGDDLRLQISERAERHQIKSGLMEMAHEFGVESSVMLSAAFDLAKSWVEQEAGSVRDSVIAFLRQKFSVESADKEEPWRPLSSVTARKPTAASCPSVIPDLAPSTAESDYATTSILPAVTPGAKSKPADLGKMFEIIGAAVEGQKRDRERGREKARLDPNAVHPPSAFPEPQTPAPPIIPSFVGDGKATPTASSIVPEHDPPGEGKPAAEASLGSPAQPDVALAGRSAPVPTGPRKAVLHNPPAPEAVPVVKLDGMKPAFLPEISAKQIELMLGGKEKHARWGELLVAQILRTMMQEFRDVRWLNELAETGQHYDVTAVRVRDGATVCVEVKTMAGEERSAFVVSAREVASSLESGDRYEFWLVSVKSTGAVSVTRIQNPAGGYGVSIDLLARLRPK